MSYSAFNAAMSNGFGFLAMFLWVIDSANLWPINCIAKFFYYNLRKYIHDIQRSQEIGSRIGCGVWFFNNYFEYKILFGNSSSPLPFRKHMQIINSISPTLNIAPILNLPVM